MKIYTKTGDKGTTSLFSGDRVPKDHLRLHAYGTLDEMNSIIGLARARNDHLVMDQLCSRLQALVFILNSDLAWPLSQAGQDKEVERISEKHIRYVEQSIDSLSAELPALTQFILPGGTETAGTLHLARTVCRRAERFVIALAREEDLGPHILKLVNRLSDYLFVLARYANLKAGRSDEILNCDFPEIDSL